MQSSKPISKDGEIYPFFSANLAITSKFVNTQFEANAVLRLVPTRFTEDGASITLDEHSKTILMGTIKDISGPELETMQKIYNAIQEYIVLKEL